MNGFTPTETTVFVKGHAIHAKVGIGAVERHGPQTIYVDLEIGLANPLVTEDHMSASYNYVTAMRKVETLCATEKMLLIETLAERIAREVFEDRRVARVTVTVTKPRKLPNAEAVGVRRTFINPEACHG